MTALTRNVGSLRAGSLVTRAAAGTIDPAESLAGQVGAATLYVTPNGTRAWARNVYATTTDDYHYLILVTPELLSRSVSTPFVVHHHGATADETQIWGGIGTPDTLMTAMLDSWIDLGYGVMSLRLGQDVTADNTTGKWGNDGARNGAVDCLNWALGIFTVDSHGFLLYGFSAGGTHAVNTLVACKIAGVKCGAAFLCDPAVSLRDEYVPTAGNSTTQLKTQIRDAYLLGAFDPGGDHIHAATVGDARWVANVDESGGAGHDPLVVALSYLPTIPFYLTYSDADTTIDDALNGIAFVARLTGAGWVPEVSTTKYTKNHGDKTHFRPDLTNPFYARALAL